MRHQKFRLTCRKLRSSCTAYKSYRDLLLKSGAFFAINPLSANPTKWSNTLKQFVGNLPTNCLSVFDHLMNLALKGLTGNIAWKITQ